MILKPPITETLNGALEEEDGIKNTNKSLLDKMAQVCYLKNIKLASANYGKRSGYSVRMDIGTNS